MRTGKKKSSLLAFLLTLDFGKLDLTDKTHSFRVPRFILATVSVRLRHICIKFLKRRAEVSTAVLNGELIRRKVTSLLYYALSRGREEKEMA